MLVFIYIQLADIITHTIYIVFAPFALQRSLSSLINASILK